MFGPVRIVCVMVLQDTTPSSSACHPSTGGELAGTEPTQPPRQAKLAPLQRRGIALCRYEDTTPSGFARHPSTGGEMPNTDTVRYII